GPAVTCASAAASHHPSWPAKRGGAAAPLAEGRLDLRLGAGAEDDAAAGGCASFGIRTPPAGHRIETLEETIQVIRGLWQTDTSFDHRGRRYALTDARLGPKPIQHPGPPIWIAAMGPRALAVTARHADGWEASYVTPEGFALRWQHLSEQLRAEGRSANAFRRSVELDAIVTKTGESLGPRLARFCADRTIATDHPLLETVLAGDGDAIARRIADYESAGATDLMLGFADFPGTGMLESFAAGVLARWGAPAPPAFFSCLSRDVGRT